MIMAVIGVNSTIRNSKGKSRTRCHAFDVTGPFLFDSTKSKFHLPFDNTHMVILNTQNKQLISDRWNPLDVTLPIGMNPCIVGFSAVIPESLDGDPVTANPGKPARRWCLSRRYGRSTLESKRPLYAGMLRCRDPVEKAEAGNTLGNT